MSQFKYNLYRLIRGTVPLRFIRQFGASNATRYLRDHFFRPTGVAELVGGRIAWDDLSFDFYAPYQIFYQAQARGIENDICRLARAVLKEGQSGIDVGASYGFVSLVMGKAVGAGGHIISFELSPYIAQGLSQNIAQNGLAERCAVIAQGAADRETRELVTVDSIVAKSHLTNIRFMKIDVDGSDFEVLVGAQEMLRLHHPVVVIEMSAKQFEIYDLLVELGYTCFMDQGNRLVQRGHWPLNLIASCEPVAVPKPTRVKP